MAIISKHGIIFAIASKIFFMKKIILIGFCFMLIMESFAQGPYVGAKYTKAYTKLKNKYIDVASNPDTTMGYVMSFGDSYGLLAGYNVTEKFGLQAELLFNTQRQKYEGDISGAYSSMTEIMTLDIPLLITVGKTFYVEGGPVFSALLKASFKSSLETRTQDVADKFNRFTWGGALGGGVNLHATDHLIFNVGSRFYLGLKDYGEGVDAVGKEIHNYKTTGWSLGLYGSIKIKI